MTRNGITLRTSVDSINLYSRMAKGVRVIDVDDDDAVVSAALVVGKTDTSEERDAINGFSPEAPKPKPVILHDEDEEDELDEEIIEEGEIEADIDGDESELVEGD